jgi:ketosteroid isomerase-like protein
MKKLVPLFLMTIAIISGSVGSALAEPSPIEVVKQANATWNQFFNQGDSIQLANLYAEDATLSPGNGQILTGVSEISGLFQSFMDNGVNHHSIELVNVYEQGEQLVQLGKWSAQGKNAENQTIEFGGVLMTVLMKNQAGEWKVHSHVWNMAN